eukprot:3617070-Prymnesium_polylepis.1
MGRSPGNAQGRLFFFGYSKAQALPTRAEHHSGPRDGRVTATRRGRSPHIPSLLSALKTPSGRL